VTACDRFSGFGRSAAKPYRGKPEAPRAQNGLKIHHLCGCPGSNPGAATQEFGDLAAASCDRSVTRYTEEAKP